MPYRNDLLFTRTFVCFISNWGSFYAETLCLVLRRIHLYFTNHCEVRQIITRLTESIRRFYLSWYRIRPFTRNRVGFISLSEFFELKTWKLYEAYRIGAFSCKQEAILQWKLSLGIRRPIRYETMQQNFASVNQYLPRYIESTPLFSSLPSLESLGILQLPQTPRLLFQNTLPVMWPLVNA